MGRTLIIWILGMLVLYLLLLALVAVLPYVIGIAVIAYVGYRIHVWLVGKDEKNQLS
jgi:hypothetical protein